MRISPLTIYYLLIGLLRFQFRYIAGTGIREKSRFPRSAWIHLLFQDILTHTLVIAPVLFPKRNWVREMVSIFVFMQSAGSYPDENSQITLINTCIIIFNMTQDSLKIINFIFFFILAAAFIPGSAAQDQYSFSNLTYMTEEFPPFNFLENGTPTGLAVDLLVAITKEAGDTLSTAKIRVIPLREGLEAVRNTPGSVIFSIARTPNREEDYRWVGPFTSYNIVLFSSRSRNITIQSPDDLKDYIIGAVTSDVSVENLILMGITPDHIVTNPDPVVLLRMLDNETVDLVTSGDIAGEYFIKKMNGNPESYRIAYRMESTPLYYAFNKETPENQIDKFQQALENITRHPPDGGLSRYDQVISTWNPDSGLSSLKFFTEEYYPLNFLENGIPAGISVDILGEVFRRLDGNLSDNQVSLGHWEDGYRKTLNQSGTAIFSTARSPERENLFQWAGPIFNESDVIFSKPGDSPVISGPQDLQGLRIGAISDDIAALDLISLGYQDIYYASDARILIKALENGTLDGWAYAEQPGRDLIGKYAEDPAVIRPVYTLKSHNYYFAFNRDTPVQIVQAFQGALDMIRNEKDQDGVSVYDRIVGQYIKPSSSPSSPGIQG